MTLTTDLPRVIDPSTDRRSRRRATTGVVALVLSLVALAGGVAAALWTGVVVADAQLAGDGTWVGMPAADQQKALVGVATGVVWCGLGIAGCVLGIVAIARRVGRGAGIVAVMAAAVMPAVAFAAFVFVQLTRVG